MPQVSPGMYLGESPSSVAVAVPLSAVQRADNVWRTRNIMASTYAVADESADLIKKDTLANNQWTRKKS